MNRKRKSRSAGLLVTIAAALAIAFALQRQESAEAASGCCSRHGGVCDCACCDGSPLSDTCRRKMPRCGGEEAARTEFSGKVVKVADGDTVEVLRDSRAVRVRLAEIDCPEKKQPFGDKARAFTAALVSGKIVTVLVRTTDRYGRTVAEILLPDGRSLNREILKAGLAWWYRDYSTDASLGVIEKEAARARLGLWADSAPIPPWVYRRIHRR